MLSIRITSKVFACLSALFLLGLSSYGQDRVAVLTEFQGSVELSRPGAGNSTVGFGTPLFADDVLSTGSGGSVSVLYSNGDLLTVGANRSITIEGSTSGGGSAGYNSSASSSAATLALHRSGEGEIAALSGLRSSANRKAIAITAPSNTALLTEQPVFSWTTAEEFSSYRVRLFTADDGIIWEAETTANELEYPSDQPALNQDVDYLWQVFGEDLLDEESSDISRIWLVDTATRNLIIEAEENLTQISVDASSGNFHLLLGSLYAESGLLNDAAKHFEALVNKYPDSVLPYELLAQVYAEMGQVDLAMNTIRKAPLSER